MRNQAFVKWEKKGLIYRPSGNGTLKTHATRPIPVLLSNSTLRLFYSSRDDDDRMLPAYIDVDPRNPLRVISAEEKPLIDIGIPGTFDDSGVTVTSALEYGGQLFFYYSGWKRRRVTSFDLSIGVLKWDEDGHRLRRLYEGPLVGQDRWHPFLAAAPFVVRDRDLFKMWYCSGTGWKFPAGRPEPKYTIFYAESSDGIDWKPREGAVIPYAYDDEVVSAPWVVKTKDGYSMWYSTRGLESKVEKNYSIGYAESKDGLVWQRLDEFAGIRTSPVIHDWDSEMVCYPAIWNFDGKTYMFYSGNDVGRGGVGYAIADRKIEIVEW